MSGSIKKVDSAHTVPCTFRGACVECPETEFNSNLCKSCGWNPEVEAQRKERLVTK